MSGFHEDLRREHSVSLSSNRSFAFVMAAAFAVFGYGPLLFRHDIRVWAAVVSGVFLVLGLVFPNRLTPLNKAWQKLGLLMGMIVSPIVLALLYFVAFMPVGILLRLLGKDVLNVRRNPSAKTYWVMRNPPGPSGATLKNQF